MTVQSSSLKYLSISCVSKLKYSILELNIIKPGTTYIFLCSFIVYDKWIFFPYQTRIQGLHDVRLYTRCSFWAYQRIDPQFRQPAMQTAEEVHNLQLLTGVTALFCLLTHNRFYN